MTSNNSSGEDGAAARPFAKLVVIAVFVAIGAAVWWWSRPVSPPDLSTYTPAPASRPFLSLPLVGFRQTIGPNGERNRIELREASHERRQTGPDTFEIVRTLIDESGHTDTSPSRHIKITPAVPAEMWPPANAERREVDLLAGLDLKTAVVRGRWTRGEDGSVQSDLEQLTRLDLGYRPPAEYDLRFTFTRLQGNDGLDTVLYAGGRQFYWTFAGWDNTTSGFGTVLGRTAETNATTTKRPAWLKNGVRYTAVIRVRRDGVQVYLNDERVAEHRTDYRDLNLVLRGLRRADSIGFSTWESGYALHDVRIVEIAGEGKRHASPATLPSTMPAVPSPIAAVDFSVADRKPSVYFLYADGAAQGMNERGQWAIAGDKIVFCWGEFIDSCTLSPDRKSFTGRNQIGDAIRGTLRAGSF